MRNRPLPFLFLNGERLILVCRINRTNFTLETQTNVDIVSKCSRIAKNKKGEGLLGFARYLRFLNMNMPTAITTAATADTPM
jgi:hypothetical protein